MTHFNSYTGKLYTVLIFTGILFCTACQNKESGIKNPVQTIITPEDLEKSTDEIDLIKVQNKIFLVPSPYQVVNFIYDYNIDYDHAILNNIENSGLYNSKFSKCINFGIYSVDLAYSNLFNQQINVDKYLQVLKDYSQELGFHNVISPGFFEQVKENMHKQDTLSAMLPETIKKIDKYLENNGRNNQSVLILTGGWIESFYLYVKSVKLNDDGYVNFIGHQKYVTKNVIEILKPYKDYNNEFAELYKDVEDFNKIFDKVEIDYELQSTEDDSFKRLTVVDSKSDVRISEPLLKNIVDRIIWIRQKMVKT